MKTSFKKIFNEKHTSLLKHIGDQELPTGKKISIYNAKKDHGSLKKDSTYMDTTLRKKGYKRCEQGKGGLSDGYTVEDIAKSHGVDYNHIVDQLMIGQEVEMEHTSDEKLAKKIAMDHLVENPDYYTKLKKIEESIKTNVEGWLAPSGNFIPNGEGQSHAASAVRILKRKINTTDAYNLLMKKGWQRVTFIGFTLMTNNWHSRPTPKQLRELKNLASENRLHEIIWDNDEDHHRLWADN
jgi:hypothetical protein